MTDIGLGTFNLEPTTARYADIVLFLPAICEVCEQEITDRVWIADGHLYCYEHAPLLSSRDPTPREQGPTSSAYPPPRKVPLAPAQGVGWSE